MRVLMLAIEAFGGLGGIAKFNRDLVGALAARPDCTEIVVVPRLMRLGAQAVPDKVVQDGRAIGGKARFVLRCLRWLVFGGRFDMIICGHLNLLPFAALWRLRATVPILLAVHGIDAWQPTPRRLVNRLIRQVSHVVAVSELTRRRFAAWSGFDPERVFILPNCVDPARYGAGAKSPALVSRYGLAGKRVIMTLGRIEPDERLKGFDQVIEALADIVRTDPGVVYLIAGTGDDCDRLRRKGEALGVGDRLIFTGLVAEAEKADHFRLADAFVLASRGEGFGIVLIEALACGIPVVGSRLDGGSEALLGGRMGRLVDPDDAAELKAAILDALDAPKGEVPKELDRFTRAAFTGRAQALFSNILGPPAGTAEDGGSRR